MTWNKLSWKKYKAKFIPPYNDEEVEKFAQTVYNKNPLISAVQIEDLKHKLSNLDKDNAFILQLGDCAETFSQANIEDVQDRIKLINTVADQISVNTKKNIIKIGRMAGQYSKPRSSDQELVNGLYVNTYKGDLIHSYKDRGEPSIERFQTAFEASYKTIQCLNKLKQNIYTSHECLILPYESSHTRLINEKYYNTSAHMLWLGYRTKFNNSAHIEYLRGIANPIGIKIGAEDTTKDLVKHFNLLNPTNESGKIIFICRFGCQSILNKLDNVLKNIKEHELNIIWMLDPMHGNTFTLQNNIKTRAIKDVIEEIKIFHALLEKHNAYFGGIHLETTPNDVTECITSKEDINDMLECHRYKSFCDPRLNFNQTLAIGKAINNLFETL